MKRKLVEQGKTTLMVSLPIDWIKRFGLKKGDEIELEEQSDSLILLPKKTVEKQKVIEVKKQVGSTFERQLSALYESGCDEVKIISSDPNIFAVLPDFLDHFIGFEIIESGKDYCIIKNVVKISEDELEPVMRRLFLVVIDLGEKLYELLKEKQFEKIGEVTSRFITVEKLSYLCVRLLNKQGYKEYQRALYLYALLRHLRRIGDDIYLVKLRLFSEKNKLSDPRELWKVERKGEVTIPKDLKFSKEAIDCFKDAIKVLQDFYTLYYNWSEEKFIEVHEKRKPIRYYPYKKKSFTSYDVFLLSCGISISEHILEMLRLSLALNFIKS